MGIVDTKGIDAINSRLNRLQRKTKGYDNEDIRQIITELMILCSKTSSMGKEVDDLIMKVR